MKTDIVLHISPNQFPPLSVEHSTKNIWKSLSSNVKEYHIIARAYNNKFSYSKEGNLHLHLIPAITKRQFVFFITSWFIVYIIKRYHINKFVVQCPIMGGFTAALCSKIFNIPFMVEIHGEEYFKYFSQKNILYKILDKIQRFTFSQAKVIRSLSQNMSDKLVENGIKNRIVIIPNRVDLKIFNISKENFDVSEPLEIVSVGRFVPAKNYETLIKVCVKKGYNLKLIGAGHLKSKYLHLIDKAHGITLIDWLSQNELNKLVVGCDLYIQSSVSEGVPRAIIEAMAMKMPIISTKAGSVEGVLVDNYNCLLIDDPLNEIEYYNAIERLKNDKDLKVSLANNAYKDVIEKYEWKKSFTKYNNTISSF